MSDITEAVETIVSALENDPGYRIAWQSNIAMAYKDAVALNPGMSVHGAANLAADNFLKLLSYRVVSK